MNVSIRKAELFDINGFLKLDKHIAPERLKTVISAGRAFVLENSGQIFGVLRYSLFWESLPFLDLIYIDPAFQRQGFGRTFMAFWEAQMKQEGFCHCLTSTQEDETAKFFYETLGYTKTGAFFPPEQEALELIYQKTL
ncbi:GNAT family N-acetyltransferase [Congzhengia sp.]|uniref:GNAT family N-acetyltransferase n=1 Tax=Congzhengia sp. TaxID=2944168 RepID=UPI003076A7F0